MTTMTVQIPQVDLGVMLRSTIDDHCLDAAFVANLIRRHFAAIDDHDKRQVLTHLEAVVAVPRNRFREEADREVWKGLIEEIMPPKTPFTVDYHCHGCKARDVKLWRGVHGYTDAFGRELLCARCLVPDATVDADGRAASKYGRTDQVGGWLPAVPCGDTFWGYTSAPTYDVRWWQALPTYATHRTNGGTDG